MWRADAWGVQQIITAKIVQQLKPSVEDVKGKAIRNLPTETQKVLELCATKT